eukprot:scaffold264951_cov23-Tisochrysis_lutea.AAC.1
MHAAERQAGERKKATAVEISEVFMLDPYGLSPTNGKSATRGVTDRVLADADELKRETARTYLSFMGEAAKVSC